MLSSPLRTQTAKGEHGLSPRGGARTSEGFWGAVLPPSLYPAWDTEQLHVSYAGAHTPLGATH